jgi:hypothetical protein
MRQFLAAMRLGGALLVVGVGVSATVPTALAENSPGPACYHNGVAPRCVQSAPVILSTGSSAGAVAGLTQLAENGPFQQIRHDVGNDGTP